MNYFIFLVFNFKFLEYNLGRGLPVNYLIAKRNIHVNSILSYRIDVKVMKNDRKYYQPF